jgi:hypothetical protein
MLFYEYFIAWFSDFEVLDICSGFLEKITNSQIFNVWKVDTRLLAHQNFEIQGPKNTFHTFFDQQWRNKDFFLRISTDKT